MAPTDSTISGKAGASDESGMAFIGAASLRKRRGLGRAQCALIVVEQRGNRGRRHVEHRLRIEAEQQRQHDQRHEDRDLAHAHVADIRERGFLQLTEDHLAVEPERVARSEEHTSELQSRQYLVCRLLLEKKKKKKYNLSLLKKKKKKKINKKTSTK